LKNIPSIAASVALLGLTVLTVALLVRPAADLDLWRVGTMALAWVAVLVTGLAARGGLLIPTARGESSQDESPAAKTPAAETPAAQTPAAETPAAKTPAVETPAVEAPAAYTPHAETSEAITSEAKRSEDQRSEHTRSESRRSEDAASARRAEVQSAALFDFARDVHATLESDKLRLLISHRLPLLLGVRDVWIVARLGSQQQLIVPSLSGANATMLVSDEPRHWATYPMKADDRAIGVMGAALPEGGFTDHEHKLFKTVASLVAQALSTATAFEAMREASLVDPLTGCATRAEGGRRLEAELRRAQRSGTTLAVLMLDLDHFKSINDRFGHKTGDAALTVLGETLLTTLRASDVRCRWGGEEFLLVLPDANVERAQRAADKLRQTIARTPVGAGDQVINVTASIGLTLSTPGETDVQRLITRADTALYDAKRTGRNRTSIILATAASRTRATDRATPEPTPVPAYQDRVASAAGESKRPWNGVERRDPNRRDRRGVPGPGRRSTDWVVAGPRRDQ
jgi:diguanylate cyclase (GGDEF)-like protein